MSAAVEKLVENLRLEDFKILKHNMTNIELLLRKGVYPYQYLSSMDKFNEISLPPRETFFSQLSQHHISEENYMHAQAVSDTFGVQTLLRLVSEK